MADSVWCVVVARCKPNSVTHFLVDFFRFVEGVSGVKSLHFSIRDRIGSDVVFSFRILVEARAKKASISKIAYKLRSLLSVDKFAVDPKDDSLFFKYVPSSLDKLAARLGQEKFVEFCAFLSGMSRTVVEMAEKKYFDTNERVETIRLVASMLGCTEYGLLTKECMEVGYYDRIENKYCPYLKEVFPKGR